MQTILNSSMLSASVSKEIASRRVLLCIAFLVSISAGSLSVADTSRMGSDPLSASEIDLVRNAALSAAEPAAQASAKSSSTQAGSTAMNDAVLQEPGDTVLLLIERRMLEKDQSRALRLADVYEYDYSDDTLIHTIVDADSGAVQSRQTLRSVQLPLIESEIERAAAIVMSNPDARNSLENSFQQVTGALLDDFEDLDFKAFIFHASTLRAELVRDAVMCGVHRCAQIVTYTRDNISLDFSPIIDLSTGEVIQLNAQ